MRSNLPWAVGYLAICLTLTGCLGSGQDGANTLLNASSAESAARRSAVSATQASEAHQQAIAAARDARRWADEAKTSAVRSEEYADDAAAHARDQD